MGLSAETESLVKLINELPSGCIDYIGAGPLHVSTTKPEAFRGRQRRFRARLTRNRSTRFARRASSR